MKKRSNWFVLSVIILFQWLQQARPSDEVKSLHCSAYVAISPHHAIPAMRVAFVFRNGSKTDIKGWHEIRDSLSFVISVNRVDDGTLISQSGYKPLVFDANAFRERGEEVYLSPHEGADTLAVGQEAGCIVNIYFRVSRESGKPVGHTNGEALKDAEDLPIDSGSNILSGKGKPPLYFAGKGKYVVRCDVVGINDIEKQMFQPISIVIDSGSGHLRGRVLIE